MLGGGQAQAAKPATAVQPPGGKPQPPTPSQQQQQPAPEPRQLVAAALASPPATAHLGAETAAGAGEERRLQEEACVG